MKTLIKNATIQFPGSEFNGRTLNVLVDDGVVSKITEDDISSADRIIESENLLLQPGWFDLRADFADPGYEHREDLTSGSNAAVAGGFTGVQLLPGTSPVLDTKTQIEYVKQRAKGLGLHILPAGAISEGTKGGDICELYDMHTAGVKAFTDGDHAIQNPDLVRRAMLYCKTFNGVLMLSAHSKDIAGKGSVHEGVVSTSLGLKGTPVLAETLMISRDLYLAEYCESPVHFSCISSAESVAIIREAKAKGMQVTCDVAVANLLYTDEVLAEFDSRHKVFPVLRTEADRLALLEGLKDGTIDAIVSNHSPWNIEEKDCEFDLAAYGMSTIQMVYPMLKEALGNDLEDALLANVLGLNPRTILGLKLPELKEDALANFTLIDPSQNTEYAESLSKSKNHPGVGKSYPGKVVGTIFKG